MIDFIAAVPGWCLAHPWLSAGIFIAGLTGFTALILLNPEGRQLREKLRRNR